MNQSEALVGDVGSVPLEVRQKSAGKTRMIVATIVGVLLILAAYMTWSGGGDDVSGQVFTIPAGAYKNVITPGIDSAIKLPTIFVFKPGDSASITVINNDSVDHRAGPFLVGAGQTYTQRFPEPGQYAINCSVNPLESITVTVEG